MTTVSPNGIFMAIFGVSAESSCPKAITENNIRRAYTEFFMVFGFFNFKDIKKKGKKRQVYFVFKQ
jgi:hypothetical protein